MSTGTLLKDPGEVTIFTMDWTPRLATGETIASSSWAVATGLTLVADGIVAGSLKTNVKLSGGTAGESYPCVNTVETSTGQTLERTGYVEVRSL